MKNILYKIKACIIHAFTNCRGEVKSQEKNNSFQNRAELANKNYLIDFRQYIFVADTVTVDSVSYQVISVFPTTEYTGEHENVADKLKYLIKGSKG